jgi:hypothetical protein
MSSDVWFDHQHADRRGTPLASTRISRVAIAGMASVRWTIFATGVVLATLTAMGDDGKKVPEYPPSTATSTHQCQVSIGRPLQEIFGFVTPLNVTYQFGALQDIA